MMASIRIVGVDQPDHRSFALFRSKNHIFDFAERGIAADFRDLDIHASGKVLCAGEDIVPDRFVHRERFAGD